jgi:hypothetical protein
MDGVDEDAIDAEGWTYALDFYILKYPPPPGVRTCCEGGWPLEQVGYSCCCCGGGWCCLGCGVTRVPKLQGKGLAMRAGEGSGGTGAVQCRAV